MQVEVSADELEVLETILESALGDTREEIYKAEVAEYKVGLKARESVIVRLLERVRALRAQARR